MEIVTRSNKCKRKECYSPIHYKARSLCKEHGYREREIYKCSFPECINNACIPISKKKLCKKHGGGYRCSVTDCKKSADGPMSEKKLCRKHGGGYRCSVPSCTTSACGPMSEKKLCVKHGGGYRCSVSGCKSSTVLINGRCAKHGGGYRCSISGCIKLAISPYNPQKLCRKHGGGYICSVPECNKRRYKCIKTCLKHSNVKKCTEEDCKEYIPLYNTITDKCYRHR